MLTIKSDTFDTWSETLLAILYSLRHDSETHSRWQADSGDHQFSFLSTLPKHNSIYFIQASFMFFEKRQLVKMSGFPEMHTMASRSQGIDLLSNGWISTQSERKGDLFIRPQGHSVQFTWLMRNLHLGEHEGLEVAHFTICCAYSIRGK